MQRFREKYGVYDFSWGGKRSLNVQITRHDHFKEPRAGPLLVSAVAASAVVGGEHEALQILGSFIGDFLSTGETEVANEAHTRKRKRTTADHTAQTLLSDAALCLILHFYACCSMQSAFLVKDLPNDLRRELAKHIGSKWKAVADYIPTISANYSHSEITGSDALPDIERARNLIEFFALKNTTMKNFGKALQLADLDSLVCEANGFASPSNPEKQGTKVHLMRTLTILPL